VKVLYLSNGLTHYYNRVLSRLGREPNVDLIVAIPAAASAGIGEGVHQTRDGADFPIVELPEIRRFRRFTTFQGLAGLLRRLRPDVVIVLERYLHAFLLDLPVVLAMRQTKARLILKSIPFQIPPYQEAVRAIRESPAGFGFLPGAVNRLLLACGATRALRKVILDVQRTAFRLPEAHVNYIEAHELWASYGIERRKIFVTRNSPDTDLLFSIRDSLSSAPPLLPPNPRRLLHVGRLVAWKRVDLLIAAFARLRQRFPDAELVVVGYGPKEAALKRLAGELGLGAAVTFAGGVYDPRLLAQYYLASGLYVLAGMGGLSINEAMCFGLPVLCSVCDGTEKFLVREGVNGRYFADGDADDLTAKLRWFFEHPEEQRAMGLTSAEIIRNEVNLNTVIRGYREALDYVCRNEPGACRVR
jgi:glycosyltransferase involved in cell wall biosynthesis